MLLIWSKRREVVVVVFSYSLIGVVTLEIQFGALLSTLL